MPELRQGLFLWTLSFVVCSAEAQTLLNRYILLLDDPPLAQLADSSASKPAQAAKVVLDHRNNIRSAQATLRMALQQHGMEAAGSVDTVLNAFSSSRPGSGYLSCRVCRG